MQLHVVARDANGHPLIELSRALNQNDSPGGLWVLIQVLACDAASVVQEQVWPCKHLIYEGEGICFGKFQLGPSQARNRLPRQASVSTWGEKLQLICRRLIHSKQRKFRMEFDEAVKGR